MGGEWGGVELPTPAPPLEGIVVGQVYRVVGV